MVWIDGLTVRAVEFVDQGEDEAGVAAQLRLEVGAACGYVLGGLGALAQQAAVFKGVADLLIELVPVSEHHDGGGARKLAADLLGEKDHGIALAAALGVPEHA